MENLDNTKPQILFVGPYPPVYGGYSTQIYNLTAFLLKEDFKITVLSFESEDKTEFPREGLRVIRINKKKNWRFLFSSLGNIPVFLSLLVQRVCIRDIASTIIRFHIVCKIVKEHNIKLAVTYNLYDSLYGFYLKKKFDPKLALFTMVFGEILQGMGTGSRYRDFLKSVLSASDRVISSSKYCAGLYEKTGFDSRQIEVIYVGVDIDEYAREGAEKQHPDAVVIPSEYRVVLFFGRFLKDMGLDVVLESIPSVLEKKKDVCFLLAGARGELDEQAKALQLKYPDRVFIHHDVPPDILPLYYRRCSILLAPTKALRACMGISIKDSMAWGKPAIVSDSGGIKEAVSDKETGLVIPLNGRDRIEPAEIEQAICTLMDNPQLMEEMGKNARQRAIELFDKALEAKRWLQLINQALA